jgi:hypothetical protein
MARTLFRSLIGHEDLALGFGKVEQERGPNVVNMQRIEATFIFEDVGEIKALNYNLYPHVGLHQIGAVIEYYYDPTSMAVPDDVLVLLPNTIYITNPGRYIKVPGSGFPGSGDGIVYTYVSADYTIQHPKECVLADSDVGPIVITLPPNPEKDNYVGVWDCGNNGGVNNIDIVRNGKTIDGLAEDARINTNNGRFDFIWSLLTWEYSFSVGCISSAPEALILDTIVASASSEYKPLEVSASLPATTFRASFPLSLAYVRINLTTAVEGVDLIVDIKMDNVSIFTTPIHIDVGMTTSVGSATPYVFAITDVPDDARFTVWILQIGTVVEGTGLKVSVTGVKKPVIL